MNTPNKLTVARMILVPFLVLFMLTDLGGEANRYIALAIFVVASVTDWFDGKLARKYNLVTNFGKFMDPLADKLLVCSAMICFIELEKLPAWFVIIIIGREFIISGFRLIAAENGVVIAANYWGKFKTVSQMIMIILLLIDLGGVFDILERECHQQISSNVAHLKASCGDDAIRSAMRLAPGEAMLLLDEICFNRLCRPVMRSLSYYTNFFDFSILRKLL